MKPCETLFVLFLVYWKVSGRMFKQKINPNDFNDELCPIFPHEWPPEEIESRLKQDDIIPDVLNITPKYVLNVSYCPGITVYFGNELDPPEVKSEPQHCSWPIIQGYNYTLLLTGPDDPSVANHHNREFLQWLVVDIPGCDVLKGFTIAKYVPLEMPPETGLHRYVFTLYMQPKIRPKWHEPPIHDYNDMHRVKFSTRKFAKKYNLGNPYAANYFTSEPVPLDDSKGPGLSAYDTGALKREHFVE